MSKLPIEQEVAAFAGRVPAWHRLGYVDPDAKPLTMADVFDPEKGDLPSEVVTRPLTVEGIGTDPRHVATVVTWDDGREAPVGIVQSGYEPFGPREGFGILSGVLEDNGLEVEAAVGLRDFRSVCLTVRLPEHFVVDEGGLGDPQTLYGGISMGNDGNAAVSVALWPFSVACINTQTAAMGWAKEHKRVHRIHHRSNLSANICKAQQALSGVRDFMAEHTAGSTLLARTPMDDAAWDEFATKFLAPEPAKGAPEYVKSQATIKRQTLELIWQGDDVDGQPTFNGRLNDNGTSGNLFAAFSAWTEYADHFRPTNDTDGSNRAVAVMEDTYAKDKTALFNRLVRVATKHHEGTTGDAATKRAVAAVGA